MSNRRAFTLIEVLVVVAIIALLMAILLPSLSSAREAGRSSVCGANLRQIYTACRMYADAYRGYGPAIGEPYAKLPSWALQTQASFKRYRVANNDLYSTQSILVCPSVQSIYAMPMLRTYAMNATGHSGQPADPNGAWPDDPDTYDDSDHPAFIRMDRVPQPSRSCLIVDSARAPIVGSAPPSSRTASMIDFRQEQHVRDRLAQFHSGGKTFNVGRLDGSAGLSRLVPSYWKQPLP